MHKVKATSFIRRTTQSMGRTTLSEQQPYPRRYPSVGSTTQNFLDHEASMTSAIYPDEHQKPTFTWASDLAGLQILLFTRLNLGLLLVPLGILSAYYQWGDLPTFWFNFVALIPLAAVLGNVTEELALHTGDLIGGLLNATFGNAVEMIITVNALRAGLLTVVQGSLLGSILSNLLLVLGMAFFCGGLFHHVQKFNAQGATCSTSLLLLASLAFMTPTVASSEHASADDILLLSRLIAVLMAITYCLFLFFQLGTHLTLFKDDKPLPRDIGTDYDSLEVQEEWPMISSFTSLAMLSFVTIVVAIVSDCLVGSIEGVSKHSGIPEGFIGVILLPIVGNAAEHATAVTVAIKNKPDLTMGVAVGSSTQIAMFMVPFAVLVGWSMDVPLSLAFSRVSVTVLTFSVLIVIAVVQDGESNWLEGVMLIVAYFIIAIVYCFDDPTDPSGVPYQKAL